MSSPTMSVAGLTVSYGHIRAVDGVDLELRPGVTAVLGANGAGKSSLVNALAGVAPIKSGRVQWDGRDVTRVPSHRRIRDLGIVLVPEGRVTLPRITVA